MGFFIKRSFILTGVAFLVMSLSGLAFANNQLITPVNNTAKTTQNNSGFYIGGQLGYVNSHYDKDWLDIDMDGLSTSVDNSGFAGRILFGYKINKYVAAEAGILLQPKIGFDVKFYENKASATFWQVPIDLLLKGILPLKYGFGLYAKGGAAYVWRGGIDFDDEGLDVGSDCTLTFVLGGGAEYHITPHIIVDASYLHYFKRGDLPAMDFIAGGLAYQF